METKFIQIPKELANPKIRFLRNIKFVNPKKMDFVLVFMSDGAVFCLDTVN